LIADVQEEIADIQWTVFGKIRTITRTSTSNKADLEFRYDASGQRVCKIVKPKDGTTHALLDQSHWTYTYYSRDASGNVMAVYERKFSANSTDWDDRLTLEEQHLYGGSRLGMKAPREDDGDPVLAAGYTFTPGSTNSDGTINVSVVVGYLTASNLPSGMRWMTRKSYELNNHLGNVYAVVTDKKMGIATTQYSTSVSYYKADVVSATDYFAFGAPENGRVFNSANYRYGFNGKENDPESVGTGEGLQDYGMRIYNPALGRFLSVDPLSPKYPWYTPYQFAGNSPIESIDLDGLEPTTPYIDWGKGKKYGAGTLYDKIDGYFVFTQANTNGQLSFYYAVPGATEWTGLSSKYIKGTLGYFGPEDQL
jgi:RHS repeat-associated protein